jgi:curli biogenesis system outer membrane secretion channel CsgG
MSRRNYFIVIAILALCLMAPTTALAGSAAAPQATSVEDSSWVQWVEAAWARALAWVHTSATSPKPGIEDPPPAIQVGSSIDPTG